MSKYAAVADIAARLLSLTDGRTPVEAWAAAAAAVFPTQPSSQEKGCPKGAFLGLCEAGHVENVPPGSYTRSEKNKAYALRALNAVRADPGLLNDHPRLWVIATQGGDLTPNHQLDVVTALWEGGWIRR